MIYACRLTLAFCVRLHKGTPARSVPGRYHKMFVYIFYIIVCEGVYLPVITRSWELGTWWKLARWELATCASSWELGGN